MVELHSTVQTWTSCLVYILPTGQAKSALWHILAAYNPTTLVLFTTTLIKLDFSQEVPYTNHTTEPAP